MFCLVCHVFKPERCYHCSDCKRCVLNGDHHCPWINNCVGFYNRKFFILMLFYVVLTTFIIICGEIKVVYVINEETMVNYIKLKVFLKNKISFFKKNYFENGEIEINWALNYFILLGAFAVLPIFFMTLCFLIFHFSLIDSNMTTDEYSISETGVSTTNVNIFFLNKSSDISLFLV